MSFLLSRAGVGQFEEVFDDHELVGAVLGELHLPSAFLFDIGVFALVLGATLLMLIALAHQSLRSPRRWVGSTAERREGAAAARRVEG